MWTYIYRHVKVSACPIAITITCKDGEDHYSILAEKLKQASELGIDLPPIDKYEMSYSAYV